VTWWNLTEVVEWE